MKLQPISLRIIFFSEVDSSVWQAQCLEHDITTQASNLHELRTRMDATIRTEIEECISKGIAPLSDIPEAPKYFYEMWNRKYGSITHEYDTPLLPDNSVSLEHAICA